MMSTCVKWGYKKNWLNREQNAKKIVGVFINMRNIIVGLAHFFMVAYLIESTVRNYLLKHVESTKTIENDKI